jgi:hypothetical protein
MRVRFNHLLLRANVYIPPLLYTLALCGSSRGCCCPDQEQSNLYREHTYPLSFQLRLFHPECQIPAL